MLQPALLVDDQHAFHHARENRDHPRAVARELVDAPAELLHGAVHRARDLAELVVAVIGRRPPQIADAHSGGPPRGSPATRCSSGAASADETRNAPTTRRRAPSAVAIVSELRSDRSADEQVRRDAPTKSSAERRRAEGAEEDRQSIAGAHVERQSGLVRRSAGAGAGSTSL